ncbi:MAG: hypothetical protein KKH98_09600, partial [Spirochaetes bacterium]|nr:hypothetical protein [Spirochaetota bacterium]
MKIRSFIVVILAFMVTIMSVDSGLARSKAARKAAVKRKVVKQRVVKKAASKRILRRTAVVIRAAHKAVKENKVYTGNLAKAIRHQKYARILFIKGAFKVSAMHSLRARKLAWLALKANKVEQPKEGEMDKEETSILEEATDAEKMDKDAEEAFPDDSIKDEDI